MLISYCFRLCCKNVGNGCFSLSNITLRLIYFFFLEVGLSLFINIALISRSADESLTSRANLIYYASLAISAFIALLIVTLAICACFGIRPLSKVTNSVVLNQLSGSEKLSSISCVKEGDEINTFTKGRDKKPLQKVGKREQ